MLGFPVSGLRTWIWATAAPALRASTAALAICSGVTGIAGCLPTVSLPPVTAQLMMTLRAMALLLFSDILHRPVDVGEQPRSAVPVLDGRNRRRRRDDGARHWERSEERRVGEEGVSKGRDRGVREN